MYSDLSADQHQRVNAFLPSADLAVLRSVNRRHGELVGENVVLDAHDDIQRALIQPCLGGNVAVHTLTLRIHSSAQRWTVGAVEPFPLPHLRSLCVRWAGRPKPAAGKSVDVSADVWALVRTVVAAAPALDTVRISKAIRLPVDYAPPTRLTQLSVGVDTEGLIRMGETGRPTYFDARHLNLVSRIRDDNDEFDLRLIPNTEALVRVRSIMRHLWGVILINDRMQSIRVHVNGSKPSIGGFNPFSHTRDTGFRIPAGRAVWLHDTFSQQVSNWWFLACGAHTLNVSMGLDDTHIVQGTGGFLYPLMTLSRMRRVLVRCPANLFIHIFIRTHDPALFARGMELILSIHAPWNGIFIHTACEYHGPPLGPGYTVHTYAGPRALKQAWDGWGIDGADRGPSDYPPPPPRGRTAEPVDGVRAPVKHPRI